MVKCRGSLSSRKMASRLWLNILFKHFFFNKTNFFGCLWSITKKRKDCNFARIIQKLFLHPLVKVNQPKHASENAKFPYEIQWLLYGWRVFLLVNFVCWTFAYECTFMANSVLWHVCLEIAFICITDIHGPEEAVKSNICVFHSRFIPFSFLSVRIISRTHIKRVRYAQTFRLSNQIYKMKSMKTKKHKNERKKFLSMVTVRVEKHALNTYAFSQQKAFNFPLEI